MGDDLILVDTPAEHVRRVTLNRPEVRKLWNNDNQPHPELPGAF